MAFGLKYKIFFPDIKPDDSEEWLAEMYFRDYSGDVSYLLASGTPMQHEFLSDNTEKFQVIKGSILDIQIVSLERDEFFEDFGENAEEKSIYVIIKKNDVNFWKGWYSIEEYEDELRPSPLIVNLSFFDGLGKLSEYSFKDENDIPYHGERSLMEIIHICLSKIGLELDLYDAIDIYERSMNDSLSDSVLTQSYRECNEFITDSDGSTKNCYEVLQDILAQFGVRICQMNMSWWIVPISLIGQSYNVRKYIDLGTEFAYQSNFTQDSSISITGVQVENPSDINVFIELSGRRRMDKAYRELVLKQNFEKKDSVNWNHSLKYWDSGVPLSFSKGSLASFYEGENNNLNWDFLTVLNLSDYIQYSFFIEGFGLYHRWKIQIEYECPYISYPYHLSLQFVTGGEYLQNDYSFDAPVNTVGIALEVDETPKKGTITIDTIEGIISGEAYLKIFAPYGAAGHVSSPFIISNIQIQVIPVEYLENYKETILGNTVNIRNNRKKTLEINSGDFPLFDTSNLFLKGGLFYKAGSYYLRTAYWHIQGESEEKSLIEILFDRFVQLHNFNSCIFSGNLLGHLTPLVYILDDRNRGFIVNDYSYDIRRGTFECQLLQITDNRQYMEWESGDGDFVEWEEGGYVETTND